MKIKCGAIINTSSGKIEREKDILITNGKIEKITESGKSDCPADIDLSQMYLLPGFVDAHNHLCFDVGDEVRQIGEHLGYQSLVAAKNARLALDSGVTTLRDAGEKGHVDFAVKRAIQEGLIPGPRIIVAGPGVMRTGGHMWYMGEESDGEAEVRKTVRRQLKAGVDFIKIFISGGATSQRTNTITPEMTKEEIEVMIYEAHAAGKKVGAHTHGGQAATWAIEAGVDSIEHGCFLTEQQLLMMKEHGTWLVVTSGIQRAIRDCSENPDFIRSKAASAYDNYISVARRAVELDLNIAVGNDTNHGCLSEEILFLEKAGMERRKALSAASLGGARLCGLDDIVGSIEAGKAADLIAFDENPLDASQCHLSPTWVIAAGKVVKSPERSYCDF